MNLVRISTCAIDRLSLLTALSNVGVQGLNGPSIGHTVERNLVLR